RWSMMTSSKSTTLHMQLDAKDVQPIDLVRFVEAFLRMHRIHLSTKTNHHWMMAGALWRAYLSGQTSYTVLLIRSSGPDVRAVFTSPSTVTITVDPSKSFLPA